MADTDKTQILYDHPSVKGKTPGATIKKTDHFFVQVFTKQIQIHRYLLCLLRANGGAATTSPALIEGPPSHDPLEPLLSDEVQLEADLRSGEEVTAYFLYILNGKEAMDASEVNALQTEFKKHVQEGGSVKDFAKGSVHEGDKYRVGE
ncbi:hypothetical protein EC919_10992 [Pseudomonas graminis]|uniref:hypothetical protein n=1 Tax=Pseudomonas graminis TaxID=158627 RepID=UPI00105BB4D5|nr:hypothetical protein [Pseudomonas graminis]TDV48148.1 hypothetical protein EC919_10992 [Pseudomonas graminis]